MKTADEANQRAVAVVSGRDLDQIEAISADHAAAKAYLQKYSDGSWDLREAFDDGYEQWRLGHLLSWCW
jgi:hypothetical protein